MAKSAKLKNKAGVVLYPMTCTDMVYDSETGETLKESLANYATKEEVNELIDTINNQLSAI